MKKKFTVPEISVWEFVSENIITESGAQTAAEKAQELLNGNDYKNLHGIDNVQSTLTF